MKNKIILIIVAAALCGCGSMDQYNEPDFAHNKYHYRSDGPPLKRVDMSHVPNAIPKDEPLSRYGNQPSYHVHGKQYRVMHSANNFTQRGIASWYGLKFHKALTSSGEPYNMYAMTAAHKRLPLPSYVRVHNLDNGREIVVKVNDRGPFKPGRIIDLSYAAAQKLGMAKRGTAHVEISVIDTKRHRSASAPVQTLSDRVASPGGYHPKLYLQTGAFSQRASANAMLSKVRRVTKHPVFIAKDVQLNGEVIYRVEIGPLHSIDESDALSNEIAGAGFDEPIMRFSS